MKSVIGVEETGFGSEIGKHMSVSRTIWHRCTVLTRSVRDLDEKRTGNVSVQDFKFQLNSYCPYLFYTRSSWNSMMYMVIWLFTEPSERNQLITKQ